jgi:RNA polymerase sigma-70 factor (ECF subfamily)
MASDPRTDPRSDPREDQDLLEAVRRGDAGAFESLYLRHRDWAFRVARRFTRDDALAMDAAQETFLYLLKRAPSLRLTARLTTFLYPVVKHNALGALERVRRFDQADADCPEPGAPEPPEVNADERLALLEAALARLTDAQSEPLLMHAADGMTHGEIALALEIPLGTVKSRIHAAVTTLRADPRLADYFEE